MRKKVVFIDDEEMLTNLFTDFFIENDQVEIKTFSDPLKGLEYINQNSVDVIICDFNMPGMRGDMVAEKVEKEIPFYFLTGNHDQNISNMPRVTGLLEKPFNFGEIEKLILNI